MFDSLVDSATRILDKFVPDADTKAKLAHDIATLADNHAHERLMGQIGVNKAEAASGSVFKGGWRPFIGWTCGAAFAYHFVLQPLLVFVLLASGVELPPLPELSMAEMLPVLGGLLGLGGFRMVERVKGVIPKGI